MSEYTHFVPRKILNIHNNPSDMRFEYSDHSNPRILINEENSFMFIEYDNLLKPGILTSQYSPLSQDLICHPDKLECLNILKYGEKDTDQTYDAREIYPNIYICTFTDREVMVYGLDAVYRLYFWAQTVLSYSDNLIKLRNCGSSNLIKKFMFNSLHYPSDEIVKTVFEVDTNVLVITLQRKINIIDDIRFESDTKTTNVAYDYQTFRWSLTEEDIELQKQNKLLLIKSEKAPNTMQIEITNNAEYVNLSQFVLDDEELNNYKYIIRKMTKTVWSVLMPLDDDWTQRIEHNVLSLGDALDVIRRNS